MSAVWNLLVPLFLFFGLTQGESAVPLQDEHKEFWKIVQAVQDILAGKEAGQAEGLIAKNAHLVCGTKLLNLRAVVHGEITACSLADTAYHGVLIEGQTNPAEDMGFIVLKTVQNDTTKVRFHSVVFLKDSTGRFKIISWHTGDK